MGGVFLYFFFLQHIYWLHAYVYLCLGFALKEGFLLIFSYIAKLYAATMLHMEKCYTCQVLLLLGKHFMASVVALLLKVGLLAV